jgi:hypothetical protein
VASSLRFCFWEVTSAGRVRFFLDGSVRRVTLCFGCFVDVGESTFGALGGKVAGRAFVLVGDNCLRRFTGRFILVGPCMSFAAV